MHTSSSSLLCLQQAASTHEKGPSMMKRIHSEPCVSSLQQLKHNERESDMRAAEVLLSAGEILRNMSTDSLQFYNQELDHSEGEFDRTGSELDTDNQEAHGAGKKRKVSTKNALL
jgi:hypothetical protein